MLNPPEPVPGATAVAQAIGRVLAAAREAGAVVIHVRHNGSAGDPDAPGTPGWELVTDVLPGEQIVDKHESNAFAGTRLADALPPAGAVVIVGMQSDMCVRETVLAARRLGHAVSLVRGAHATYDDDLTAEEISQHVERELEAAGVSVLDADAVAFS